MFEDRRKTGRLDLEATEMAMRSALHRAGAAALSQLLEFPAPTEEGRTLEPLTFSQGDNNGQGTGFSQGWRGIRCDPAKPTCAVILRSRRGTIQLVPPAPSLSGTPVGIVPFLTTFVVSFSGIHFTPPPPK